MLNQAHLLIVSVPQLFTFILFIIVIIIIVAVTMYFLQGD